jgi:hypothetical protein
MNAQELARGTPQANTYAWLFEQFTILGNGPYREGKYHPNLPPEKFDRIREIERELTLAFTQESPESDIHPSHMRMIAELQRLCTSPEPLKEPSLISAGLQAVRARILGTKAGLIAATES